MNIPKSRDKNVDRKTWDEFCSTGLLLFVNQLLHVFGWAIVVDGEGDSFVTKEAYPARVGFRGFHEASEAAAYEKVTAYMKDNIDDLAKEIRS